MRALLCAGADVRRYYPEVGGGGCQDLGCRVQGLKMQGAGCRVQCVGFGVWDIRFMV